MRSFPRIPAGTALLIAAVAVTAATTTAVAYADEVTVNDVVIKSDAKTKLVAKDTSVRLAAPTKHAHLSFALEGALEKRGGGSVVAFGQPIRHANQPEHAWTFDAGRVGHVSFAFSGVKQVITPELPARSFGVKVYEDGALVRSVAGQTKALELKSEAPRDAQAQIDVGVEFAQGAWSFRYARGKTTIVVTPEGVQQTLADGPTEIAIDMTGLDAAELGPQHLETRALAGKTARQ